VWEWLASLLGLTSDISEVEVAHEWPDIVPDSVIPTEAGKIGQRVGKRKLLNDLFSKLRIGTIANIFSTSPNDQITSP
jgi:hypothetical protein